MKFPEYRLSMEAALPSSVQTWLDQELEGRGIDSLVYSRYIISLLQRDPCDLDVDGLDADLDFFSRSKVELRRSKSKRLERKKWLKTEEEKKKLAAVECLSALTDENAEIEALVEELCARLKDLSASQASVCPTVDVQSALSTTDSSEDSGSENQNPAERYYAAFPSLKKEEAVSSGLSPLVTSGTVWSKNKVVSKPALPTAEATKEREPCRKVDLKVDKKESHTTKQAKFEKKRRLSGIEKKKHNYPCKLHRSKSSKAYHPNSKNTKIERNKSWSHDSRYFGQDGLQGIAYTAEEQEGRAVEKQTPERENEALCTRVESLLKGMLLPVPVKTYKELQDVDYDCVFEQRERTTKLNLGKPVQDAASRHPEDKSAEGIHSPDVQEQDIWYTQPIDIIFQQAEETGSRHLYERRSNPCLSSDNSGSTSPVQEPVTSLSNTPCRRDVDGYSNQEEVMEGSVLIPAWMTDELCLQDMPDNLQEDLAPDSSDLLPSSFKSEYCGDDQLPLSSVEEHQCLFNLKSPEEIWDSNSIPIYASEARHECKLHESRTWSTNDDDNGDFITPVPSSQPAGIQSRQAPPAYNHSNTERPTSSESVSLVDMDYLAGFLKLPGPASFELHNLMGNTVDSGRLEMNESGMFVYHHPFVTSDLQQNALFDNSFPYSESLFSDNFEVPSELPYWLPPGNGRSLSQLWDINQQKRMKLGFDGRNSELQTVYTDHGGLFCQGDYLLTHLQERKSYGRENTLIPHISVANVSDEHLEEKLCFEPEEARGTAFYGNFEKSKSFGDMRSIYTARNPYNSSDPKLSFSFDLIPSERSAFVDVSYLHHGHSEPNLSRLRYSGDLPTKAMSPQEHLFYSPKTHFRPITPANPLEQIKPKPPKLQEYKDLFGGHLSSKTPYQQFHGKHSDDEGESFVPKFKIKNSSKYIQTGESLEREDGPVSPQASSSSEGCDTPEALTMGMLEDMVLEGDDPVKVKEREDEELDNANTDSAYETDYGISVADQTESATREGKAQSPEVGCGGDVRRGDHDGFGLTTLYYENLKPALHGDGVTSERLHHETVQQVQEEPGESAEDSHNPWGVSVLWGTDIDDDYPGGYDEGSQSWVDKYRNIWSSGGEAFMPDFCLAEVNSSVEYSEEKSDCDTTDPGLLDSEGYFRVRLVNKDKLRDSDDPAKKEAMTYGLADLMPMPNDAKLSSDLEKEWLDPNMQFLTWMSRKKSRSQRKPCSFFLEGHCRRSDCKFAHDISNITCRFWEEGGCFKGPLCPFLHGYPSGDNSSPEETASKAKDKESFDLQSEEFPDLGQSLKASGNKKSRPNRCQHPGVKDKNGRKASGSRRSNSRQVKQDKKE